MPLRDLQERARELGRIRVGLTVERGGKRVPVKLDTFRLTTSSRNVADHAAKVFGGTVTPWVDGPQRWQLITEQAQLPVIVPPGEPLTQWYELWSGGGCQRRCDGEQMQPGRGLEAGPCQCPADLAERMELAGGARPRACKPTSRLQVMLPQLPDLGVWRYETHGYNGAAELGGTTRVLAAVADRSVAVQALLRIEERTVTRAGQTSKFPVVVIEVQQSLAELAAVTGGGGQFAGALGGTQPPAPAAIAAAVTQQWPEARRTVAELLEDHASPQAVADAVKQIPAGDVLALNDLFRLTRAHPDWREEYVEDEPEPAPWLTLGQIIERERHRIEGPAARR
jgi:hypothetical protein